jgi:ribonucleoside-diphosphate reductase beta chain
MKDLTAPRLSYSPFEYPEAHDYFVKQSNSHWLWTSISLAKDIEDFINRLPPESKQCIGHILKGFVTVEQLVADYWSSKVSKWFPKPEIAMMANTFAAMEAIHTKSYAYLNESLGLNEYEAFLVDPTVSTKLNSLIDVKGDTIEEKAKSLAVFSAFGEGVMLFSSFAILMNFSRFDLMTGVGKIVRYSSLDENLHSEAGCWLFREVIKENPHIWTDEFKKTIYQAARDCVSIEDQTIEQAFKLGSVHGVSEHGMKQFIRHRANIKLQELGLKANWRNLDKEALKELDFFDSMFAGVELQDFISTKPTAYAKGMVCFEDDIFE